MNYFYITAAAISFLIIVFLTFTITKRKYSKKSEEFSSLNQGIDILTEKLSAYKQEKEEAENKINQLKDSVIKHESAANNEINKINIELSSFKEGAERTKKELIEEISKSESEYNILNEKTIDLQQLRSNSELIAQKAQDDEVFLNKLKNLIADTEKRVNQQNIKLDSLMSKIDLYSRVDEFVSYGHFELPDYLYQTSDRYTVEIKKIRDQQKQLIKNGEAFITDDENHITGFPAIDKRILDGQMKLVMRTFNIESDFIIGKVTASNLERSLSRIEKIANELEKVVASLRSGIATEYVKLKYDECNIQYQFNIKKKEEQEEQRLIREQMREEAKAEKEYREAIIAAEKEEQLYRELLNKARIELEKSSEEERAFTEAKILELERQLSEAEAKEERAKSLAQQTRRGHVYVISNIGSFGENIYKIGMTRRLDPTDRVKELGDASVPFGFDVHAMIFSNDAPAMEASLHRAFSHHRVNAVNLRKEFFNVDINDIKEAVKEIDGGDADFITTIAAEEYYESLRLREITSEVPYPNNLHLTRRLDATDA